MDRRRWGRRVLGMGGLRYQTRVGGDGVRHRGTACVVVSGWLTVRCQTCGSGVRHRLRPAARAKTTASLPLLTALCSLLCGVRHRLCLASRAKSAITRLVPVFLCYLLPATCLTRTSSSFRIRACIRYTIGQ
ncbi:MAG: hypothetical protein LBK25_01475 [Treponema sp.]|nr:hypothetical protein [Treponema sp.]